MAKSILLMWSGGVSSTAMLFQLLTDSEYKDYDIIAHHCHISDICNKAIAEAVACKNILDYLEGKKKYRKFFFSESSHNYTFLTPPRYNRNLHDLDMVTFMASQMVAGNHDIKYVLFGGTNTDAKMVSNYVDLRQRTHKIMYEALVFERDNIDVTVQYPYENASFEKVFKLLPRTVKKKPWSCMIPTYYEDTTDAIPCGKCIKCKMRSDIGVK